MILYIFTILMFINTAHWFAIMLKHFPVPPSPATTPPSMPTLAQKAEIGARSCSTFIVFCSALA